MTSVLSHPTRRRRADRHPPPVPDVPAGALRRPLRDQPVDGPRRAGRPRPRAAPVGGPARHLPRPRPPASTCSPPVPGLPDMVFAANGATVLDGTVLGARFRHASAAPRRPRTGLVRRGRLRRGWSSRASSTRARATCWSPAPGDRVLLAGTGFRTDPRAHAEAAAVLGLPVLPLELVDPRYYHLDTALAVLDATTIAWLPEAFSPRPAALLAARFPDAVVADPSDAAVLGLNAVSDGRHVVLPAQAAAAGRQLAERGFEPSPGRPVRAAQGRWRGQVLHVGGPGMTDRHHARPRPTGTSAWSPSTRRTTTTRFRWWSRTPKAPGSPTSRAGATWTAWPGTPRSTSGTATRHCWPRRTGSWTG